LNLPNKVVSDDAVEESLANSVVTTPSSCVEVTTAKRTATEKEDEEEEDTHSARPPPTSHTTARIWTRDNLPIMQYDPEKNHGTLYLILQKEEEGHWTDLDLLGRLQQQQSKKKKCCDDTMTVPSCNPLVTVISSSSQQVMEEEEYENYNGLKSSIIEEENALSSSSDVMTELLSIHQKRQPTYGLFQQFSNVFRDYAREGLVHDMLECPNPDEVYDDDDDYDDDTDDCDNLERCSNYDNNDQQQHHPRRKMRLQMENDKFDANRYLNDLHIDEEGDMIFDTAMCMIPHWSITRTMTVVDQQQSSSSSSVEDLTNDMSKLSTVTGCDNNNNSNEDNNNQNQCSFFTADESHLLATIPYTRSVHQIYTITNEQKRSAYLTLTDILFAYAFDHRMTDGEFTVESSWTISTLSISLSWLENFNPPYDTIVDVLRWNIRRSLIYPYVRNHMLSMMIVNDVCQIILAGRRTILRSLLHVHTIMEKSESHYLFNKLYIHPLIGWVQQYCTEDEVLDYGKEIETLLLNDTSGILFGKNCLELGLVELEESMLDDDGSTDSSSDG
jgi:protein SHQ1